MTKRRVPTSDRVEQSSDGADMTAPSCARPHARGTVLDVSVSPNAPRTEVVGLHDGALRMRLAAMPVGGQANEALTRWVAHQLGVPRHHVELLRGDNARRKQLLIHASPNLILEWLRAVLKS